MNVKKVMLFIVIILLLLSIYHDLQKGIVIYDEPKTTVINEQPMIVVKKRAKPGDTILSLIETVNHDTLEHLDVQQLISDFKNINPQLMSNDLEVDELYFVPVYK